MAVVVKTAIRKGEAFIAQILSTGVYTDFTAGSNTFVITFPDLSVLTIFNTFFVDPNYIRIDEITSHITTYYNTNLLADLTKWGFDIDSADKFIHISLDDLKDSANAAKFSYVDADGNSLAFDYTKFPDGVYKIVTSGTSTPGGEVVAFTCRVFSENVSAEYLSTSATAYLELKADETAYKQDVDNLKDLIMKFLIIQYAARYDFENGYFTACNEKAAALKAIIDTGIYVFKPGH